MFIAAFGGFYIHYQKVSKRSSSERLVYGLSLNNQGAPSICLDKQVIVLLINVLY